MANTILEKLQEKYPNAEGINDTRNIAEAVACINGTGSRGANAIADHISKQFTISFNLNGGSGTTPASVTKAEGSVITLPDGTGLTAPENKKFAGWGSTALAEEADIESPYTVTEDVTLYAVWGLEK